MEALGAEVVVRIDSSTPAAERHKAFKRFNAPDRRAGYPLNMPLCCCRLLLAVCTRVLLSAFMLLKGYREAHTSAQLIDDESQLSCLMREEGLRVTSSVASTCTQVLTKCSV